MVRLTEQVESLRRELTRELDNLRREVAELERQFDGPPRADSIRTRMHRLESDASSARFAQAALERARNERRYRLGVFEWIAGPFLGIAATVGAAAILRALGIA